LHNFNAWSIILSLILVIVIVGLGVVNFAGINIPYLDWLKDGVFNLLSPVLEVFTGFYNSLTSYWNGLMRASEILKENKMLQEKVYNLERRIIVLQEMEKENIRLKELEEFRDLVSDYKMLGARVIGLNPSNWDDRIVINKGSRDGIKKKMPVISYNGTLVGRIESTGAFASQVRLISDLEFVVGGIVQRAESRAIGLVKGQFNNNKINIMDNISWDSDIKEGDLILTSGFSDSYPKGLPIGRVIKVETDNYGLSQKAELELFFNQKTIEEVMVITSF
jgi:rod shape-determining protein MreC